MMSIRDLHVVSSRVLDGQHFTVLGSYWFLGNGLNMVLLRIVAQAIAGCQYLSLYEGYQDGLVFRLLHGVDTKPVKVAVTVDEQHRVCVSEGYLTNEKRVIDWSRVGAVEKDGQIVWTHPKLDINLRLFKANKMNNVRHTMLVRKEKVTPYKNLTEFKTWLKTGRVLRVVQWRGYHNRRGLQLVVTRVIKNKGFEFDVYFGMQKIGHDIMVFRPASCYEFGHGGVISIYTDHEEFICSLEPLNNS
jgi:hypothetical protein